MKVHEPAWRHFYRMAMRRVLDIRKIEDYCLSPSHPRGRHKARVFREALGLERSDAAWLRDVLLDAGAMMSAKKITNDQPSVLNVVALLKDVPAQRLARGQVGTVVDELDAGTLLVEFSDDQGRAYAITPCPRADLLLLHYVPEAA